MTGLLSIFIWKEDVVENTVQNLGKQPFPSKILNCDLSNRRKILVIFDFFLREHV
jgi:hypothetical protein